jgi:hypothetical protein
LVRQRTLEHGFRLRAGVTQRVPGLARHSASLGISATILPATSAQIGQGPQSDGETPAAISGRS